MDDRKRIAMTIDRAVQAFGLAQLVEASGVKRRTIQNHAAGICLPNAEHLIRYTRAIREEQPEIAVTLLGDFVALAGYEVRPMAQVCPETAPALAALHVSAETGDVVRWAEAALADGVIDHVEAMQGEREVRQARHALDGFGAIVRGAAARTPQLALSGGSR
jgi:hypothetical protein